MATSHLAGSLDHPVHHRARSRLAPFVLAVLAAVTAEFLLGDQYLSGRIDWGQQLGMLVIFTLFYGSAAVLVREITRRTGRGWPTVLLLALGFGLLEEGVVTQTLWNPHYLGLDLITYGHVPGLGIGLPWTIFVLCLHVVWSMSTPIAVTEALFPRAEGPWLGRWRIIIPVVLMAVGGVAIFAVTYLGDHFVARPWQLGLAVLAAVVVIALALTVTPRPHSTPPRGHRATSGAALVGAAAGTAFMLAHRLTVGPAALTVAAQLAVVVLLIILARSLRLRPFGLAVGAAATYGWVGLAAALPAAPVGVIEQLVIMAGYAVVLISAWRRSQAAPTGSSTERPDDGVVNARSQAAPGASSSRHGATST